MITIEAVRGTPIAVTWLNELKDVNGSYLPHLLPVDPTLHWANPPGLEGAVAVPMKPWPASRGRNLAMQNLETYGDAGIKMGMSLVESPQHLKRKTGRPKGRPVGSANPGLADRLKRWRWSERCAERTPKLLAFYDEVLDTKAEDGKGPDGHGWAYTFEQRRAIAQELRESAFGKPAQQVSVDQTNVGISKIIHEIQWLPPDPNDRSMVIEPEPD